MDNQKLQSEAFLVKCFPDNVGMPSHMPAIVEDGQRPDRCQCCISQATEAAQVGSEAEAIGAVGKPKSVVRYGFVYSEDFSVKGWLRRLVVGVQGSQAGIELF